MSLDKFKPILITALIAAVTIAIVSRVPKLRAYVFGA